MSVALTSRASDLECGGPYVARFASFDLLYSSKLGVLAKPSCFEAYRKIAQKLLMRHLVVTP